MSEEAEETLDAICWSLKDGDGGDVGSNSRRIAAALESIADSLRKLTDVEDRKSRQP